MTFGASLTQAQTISGFPPRLGSSNMNNKPVTSGNQLVPIKQENPKGSGAVFQTGPNGALNGKENNMQTGFADVPGVTLDSNPIPLNVINPGAEFSPGKMIANVGGFPIFRADVIGDINQLIESSMATAPESVKQQQRELALPFAVERAIEQKLLYADAIRTMPDRTKLDEILSSIRGQFTELRLPEMMKNLKVKTPAEVESKLRDLGTSLRHVRDAWVDAQFAGFFVREKVNVDPEITHFEMLEYYNENRKDYYFPSQVRWEQIVIRFDKQASRQAAWDRIGELGNEIVFGASLAAIAKRSSEGFQAEKGGYHDWTSRGSLVNEIVEKAIFSLPVNQLSDRIESKSGFHIIRVLERKQEGYISFSEAQAKIKSAIKKEKQEAVLQKYVDKLKKEIPVENYVSSDKK